MKGVASGGRCTSGGSSGGGWFGSNSGMLGSTETSTTVVPTSEIFADDLFCLGAQNTDLLGENRDARKNVVARCSVALRDGVIERMQRIVDDTHGHPHL